MRPAARILLGVTAGVAAYRAAELVRLLQQSGLRVRVIQTPSSEQFVGHATFAALSDVDDAATAYPHLDSGREADLMVIAPATANTIAKLAHGIADNDVCAAYLAFEGPVLVCPAMNVRMWRHPATQRAISTLRDDGVTIVGPGHGRLACGDVGEGRLADPAQIVTEVLRSLDGGSTTMPDPGSPLSGTCVLVTAGGTQEPIDDVRFIGNRSSGRMGLALAQQAAARGAEIRLIVTESVSADLISEHGVIPVATVRTAADLGQAIDAYLPGTDLVLMAAAVSDFTVDPVDGKLDRDAGGQVLSLRGTTDLLASMVTAARSTSRRPIFVGFAADPGVGGLDRARAKLARKGVDMIVHNDVGRADIGFESVDNEVTIITAAESVLVPRTPKIRIADAILDAVEPLLHSGDRPSDVAPTGITSR